MQLKQSIPATLLLTVCACFLSPLPIYSAAIQVNTICELGSCGSPAAITVGQSVGPSAFSYTYMFSNGDTYSISGSYSASFPSGTSILFAPVATYTGVSPSVGNDVLTLDMFQNYSSPGSSIWDGLYHELVPLVLSSSAGAGSVVSGQVLYDGQSVGLAGPFGPGINNISKSTTLTGLNGPTLMGDVNFVFDFAAGSLSGASAASPVVPEPGQTFTFGLGLLVLVYIGNRLKKRA